MEDVLDLYAEAPDERRPVVCFDETPRQLIGESRVPVAAKPGRPARVDYEYVRNGTANVFMFVDAHRPWRHAKVTDRRTSRDFAECMRDLVDKHYPKAERIRVVMDNLSTHTPAALYEHLRPRRGSSHPAPTRIPLHPQARQLAEHGGDRDRRHGRRSASTAASPDKATLVSEVAAWKRRRNREKARINWLFTVQRAREKLGRAYPDSRPPARLRDAAA